MRNNQLMTLTFANRTEILWNAINSIIIYNVFLFKLSFFLFFTESILFCIVLWKMNEKTSYVYVTCDNSLLLHSNGFVLFSHRLSKFMFLNTEESDLQNLSFVTLSKSFYCSSSVNPTYLSCQRNVATRDYYYYYYYLL